MTLKEWNDAGRDCTNKADGTYEFRCSLSEEADLPTDVMSGSSAIVDDGAALAKVKVLKKTTGASGASVWVEM